MTADRISSLFYELFSGLARQGPGSSASTRRALASVPELSSRSRVLDVGCGTGAPTMVLATSTPATIVAIDSHEPYITFLNEQANALKLADRIVASVGDMKALGYANASFDLIWCEGAIYNVGVETALETWRRLLRYQGFIVFTEVCWRKSNPPNECRLFWEAEYPAIRTKEALLSEINACGYRVIDHFPLTRADWWDEYYRPLQDKVNSFRRDHLDDFDAQHLANSCQHEIDVWHRYSEFYDYEFFVIGDG